MSKLRREKSYYKIFEPVRELIEEYANDHFSTFSDMFHHYIGSSGRQIGPSGRQIGSSGRELGPPGRQIGSSSQSSLSSEFQKLL